MKQGSGLLSINYSPFDVKPGVFMRFQLNSKAIDYSFYSRLLSLYQSSDC